MGDLSTPKSVQKLQTALHAKAKAEAGYRFYALYDKISREDNLWAVVTPGPLPHQVVRSGRCQMPTVRGRRSLFGADNQLFGLK